MAKIGRPHEFTQGKADHICSELSLGRSLRNILDNDTGMPAYPTFFRWLRESAEFNKQYAEAREIQAERMAEEIFDIADDSARDTITKIGKDGEEYESINNEWVQRSKLRVDARKWYLSKILPKKYGEKLQHTGEGGGAIEVAIKVSRIEPERLDESDD